MIIINIKTRTTNQQMQNIIFMHKILKIHAKSVLCKMCNNNNDIFIIIILHFDNYNYFKMRDK